jgi:hypothetical protein
MQTFGSGHGYVLKMKDLLLVILKKNFIFIKLFSKTKGKPKGINHL